jgi:uncharacterized protein YbjQ (UPF0145 family)
VQILASKSVPGRKLKDLGIVYASETALTINAANRSARNQLEKQASDKGADAIVGYRITKRFSSSGKSYVACGTAVKFID